MKKEEFKVYVSKVEKSGTLFLTNEEKRFLVIKTSFSKNNPLEIKITDEMINEDSVFIEEVASVMGIFFAKFLDSNNDRNKHAVGNYDVSYHFNHEYSASGFTTWVYKSSTQKEDLTLTTHMRVWLPLSEREVILFSRGVQKYFSR